MNKEGLKQKLLLALAGLVLIATIALIMLTGSEKNASYTVGLIMTGETDDDGWNSAHYNGVVSACEKLGTKLIVKENVTWLTEKMVLFKNFERRNSYETVNPKFFLKTEDEYRQDLFAEEIALGLVTEEGLVLIVGCSHVGIVNIVEHVKEEAHLPICAVLGGTHLVEAGEERLWQTVERLRAHGIGTIAVSHCTGEKGMELLRKEFSDGFVQNNTGHVMSF